MKSALGSGIWQLEAFDFMTSLASFMTFGLFPQFLEQQLCVTSKMEEVPQDEGIVKQRWIDEGYKKSRKVNTPHKASDKWKFLICTKWLRENLFFFFLSSSFMSSK